MKDLLRGRRAAVGGLAVLGVTTALVLLVVLPAAATGSSGIKPPSIPKDITPIKADTGGQSNDCAVFYGSKPGKPAYQYRITNPTSQTYSTTVNGTTVTFTLTMNPPNTSPSRPAYGTDKYMSFTSTGAAITDVGIKGGSKTARYNYSGKSGLSTNQNYGAVTSDGYLHAPAQSVNSSGNPTSLYSISHVTFCFDLAGSVSGTVYGDTDQNGDKNGSEAGQQGWTVRLYKGVTAGTEGGGTLAGSATTAADGSYKIVAPLSSGLYRVCEAPPSGTWAQSEPLPSTPDVCNGSGELRKGHEFTFTADVTGKDFGNVAAVPCSTDPFGTSNENYVIQMAECKADQLWAFNQGAAAGNQFSSVWVADETNASVPLVERLIWSFSGNAQNQVKIIYDDVFPFAREQAKDMLFCKLDPRETGSEFDLADAFDELSEMGGVLPSGETSCLIVETSAAKDASGGTYTAYVYSSVDGWRSTG